MVPRVAALGRRVPERVQVERPQPRSGEDDRPGPARARWHDDRPRGDRSALPGAVGTGEVEGEPGSSLSRLLKREDQVGWEGLRSGGAIQWRAVYAARGFAAPAGAKGWEVVSMYQIASASRRARSTRAILAPRWRPSRVLVRW